MTIELKGVNFCHAGTPEKNVLNITDWSVAPGEQVFVHGPSGSGKSTLLNLVSGLLHCPQGEVSVLGNRLDQMNNLRRDRFRANHIGYVFQHFNLIPYLNALENIELANSFSQKFKRRARRSDIENLLNALNVNHSEWKRPAAQLSMGQQQRVAIARALINRPQCLIADEPTSSLDYDNRDKFLSVLMPLAKEHNMTVLFVSHDMGLAKYFERVQALSEFSAAPQ